jgi:hypothetical protein
MMPSASGSSRVVIRLACIVGSAKGWAGVR